MKSIHEMTNLGCKIPRWVIFTTCEPLHIQLSKTGIFYESLICMCSYLLLLHQPHRQMCLVVITFCPILKTHSFQEKEFRPASYIYHQSAIIFTDLYIITFVIMLVQEFVNLFDYFFFIGRLCDQTFYSTTILKE